MLTALYVHRHVVFLKVPSPSSGLTYTLVFLIIFASLREESIFIVIQQ